MYVLNQAVSSLSVKLPDSILQQVLVLIYNGIMVLYHCAVISIAVQWVAKPDQKVQDGIRFSNIVTEKANVDPKSGDPQTFLSVGAVITQTSQTSQSRFLVVQVISDPQMYIICYK